MTNSGETEKAYAGQQGECALWKARSLAALEEYNGQVCSKYFYCWSEDLVDASVSAESRAAAAMATQKAREDTAWLDGGQHRKPGCEGGGCARGGRRGRAAARGGLPRHQCRGGERGAPAGRGGSGR